MKINKEMFEKTVEAVKASALGDPIEVKEGHAYLLQDAYPTYDEIYNHVWQARAVVINTDSQRVSVIGHVRWVFDDFIDALKADHADENGVDVDDVDDSDVVPEDGADWPWSDMPDFSAYRANIWAEDDFDLDEIIDDL